MLKRGADPESRELYARHATKNGRSILTMTALDYGEACVVDVRFDSKSDETKPRSYSFSDAQQASTFVTEAVEALIYLGCEIHA